MNNNELKCCPFCGHKVKERKDFCGITFFICTYWCCGACVSFHGIDGKYEAENPRENFNRRADNVAPVVKCKDCKYWWDAKTNKKGFLICTSSGMEITADDFCSYAERKEV